MSSIPENNNNLAFNPIETGMSIDQRGYMAVPQQEIIYNKNTYKTNEVIDDLLSDSSSDNESDDESDEKSDGANAPIYNNYKTLNEGSPMQSVKAQEVTLESASQFNSLSITFRMGKRYNQAELFNIANQIKVDSQKTKFLRLSFRNCRRVDDADLANIGAILATKLGHVEYLSLNFWKSRRTTVFGILQLLKAISGNENTLKSLRIRIRRHRYIGNQSAMELVRGIRNTLVNLEELCMVTAGNFWLTPKGIKALREDTNLSHGLKKYEIIYSFLGIVSLFKDDAAKDMTRYINIMDKFEELPVTEGALVSNKMFVWFKRVVYSKVTNVKVLPGDKIRTRMV